MTITHLAVVVQTIDKEAMVIAETATLRPMHPLQSKIEGGGSRLRRGPAITNGQLTGTTIDGHIRRAMNLVRLLTELHTVEQSASERRDHQSQTTTNRVRSSVRNWPLD